MHISLWPPSMFTLSRKPLQILEAKPSKRTNSTQASHIEVGTTLATFPDKGCSRREDTSPPIYAQADIDEFEFMLDVEEDTYMEIDPITTHTHTDTHDSPERLFANGDVAHTQQQSQP